MNNSNTSWQYKIFYYTCLSFLIISVLSSFSTFVKTGLFQLANLDPSGSTFSLTGLSSGSNNKKDSSVYTKEYLQSGLNLALSVVVLYFFYTKIDKSKIVK